jgi:ligand-binding sensor domain-containing protein
LSERLLDNENGALGGRVNSFHEDKDGFIWLGTPKGIARYDGHQFRWLTLTNSKLRGIPGVDKFAEDDEGNLWTFSFGAIDIIDTKTFEIRPFEEKLGIELPIAGVTQHITQTSDNYIFFRDKNTETWYKYHSSIGLVEADFFPKKFHRVEQQGDNFWLYPADRNLPIQVFNYKTGKKIFEYQSNEQNIFPVHASNFGKDIVTSCAS